MKEFSKLLNKEPIKINNLEIGLGVIISNLLAT